MKKITLSLVLSWIFGIFFLIIGFGMIVLRTASIISGVVSIFMALVILPPASKFVERKWEVKLSGWLKLFIVVLGVIIVGYLSNNDITTTDPIEVDSLYTKARRFDNKIEDFQYLETDPSEKLAILREQSFTLFVYLSSTRDERRTRIAKIMWEKLRLIIELEIMDTKDMKHINERFQNLLIEYNKLQNKLEKKYFIKIED